MFDCAGKSQYIGGQKEKFVRLDELDSSASVSSSTEKMKRCGFSVEALPFTGRERKISSKSLKYGIQRGSDGLMTFGRSLKTGVTRAVFPEDLRVSDKKIFDPQDKSLLLWNRLFVIACIFAISIDPLFFYLPIFVHGDDCLSIDTKLADTTITLRTLIDAFYLIRMALQFRTAYIAPSSRVFGRGELVIDPAQIANRYLHRYFFVDFASVLPLPQIVVWLFLHGSKGSTTVLSTKQALLWIVWFQLVPRFIRLLALNSDLKKSAGAFAESAWAGAAYYLLWFLLASQVTGAAWYLLSVERYDTCWRNACIGSGKCKIEFLYCGNKGLEGYDEWRSISVDVLNNSCNPEGDHPPFNFGIFETAISSQVISTDEFFPKFLYCLWWGLKNLSTLGQGLQTSTFSLEILFSIWIGIFGLILFALLIGNIQTYLQSLTIRLEEMRIKRRDSEQWMHHRWLPQELRERVRRYDQYKWLETRGVDEENIVQSLPKDLRRDIKRHLCLNLVRRVPLFATMDERLLDAICERLKPSLCTENTFIVREGDPVVDMLFIIRGHLESVTTDGGRSGFFNSGLLKEGDFCGEELLTWALDPRSGSNLPLSTRTVKALTEVEAFALEAEELKFVASQFRHLHSKQVQYTFRFYSQQWRTWAACFIQAAWRHYKRKLAEKQRREEEEGFDYGDGHDDQGGSGKPGLGATILATRFAANALRGHRVRSASTRRLLLKKPPEPDFSAYDDTNPSL